MENKVIIWNKLGEFWDWSSRTWVNDPIYTPKLAMPSERVCLDASGDLGVDYDYCVVDPSNKAECDEVIKHARKGEMGFIL